MDVQATLEALYQKALDLKAQGRLVEADAVEAEAAGLLTGLRQHIEARPEDPEIVDALLVLADKEWTLFGDDPRVQKKIRHALDLCETHWGSESVRTAEVLSRLAEFHYLAGRLGEAEALYQRSISLFEKEPGAGRSSVVARALEGWAQTLATLGRTEDADPVFAKAIAKAPDTEQGKRSLYFLLMARADGLDQLKRGAESGPLRRRAAALLPKNNPGEQGFHV